MYHLTSRRTEGKGQTVDYVEHGVLDSLKVIGTKHTLRIRIHDDSYASQAWGRVERWDGERWQEVASVRGDALKLDHGVGYKAPELFLKAFLPDRDFLIGLAAEIL